MICGIDLGTTNSLIGHGNTLYTGLVSSSVDISKKEQVARDNVSDDIVSSYKVDMTTGDTGRLPIACSAIVLKKLCAEASRKTGEYIEDVIVSVPAKFSTTQREAVYRAGEEAGINVVGLINEPTAAAIYVCRDLKDLVVVYDLGGGTFDVTVLDARVGSYMVVATDGNGHLAGDNFDQAIAEEALNDCKVKMRYRSKNNLKSLCADVRIAKEILQRTGLTQHIDLSMFGVSDGWDLTVDRYVSVMQDVFMPTINLTKKLIQMNISPDENPKLIFVGGSTACPYLRQWVLKETGLTEYECNDMPDLIVAKGVALYAQMYEEGIVAEEVMDVTKCLSIENRRGLADVVIEKNTIIPVSEVCTFINRETSRYLSLKLYQGDSIVSSENDFIGELIYDYGEVREAGKGIVEVEISVDRNGMITFSATDIVTNETQTIKLVTK